MSARRFKCYSCGNSSKTCDCFTDLSSKRLREIRSDITRAFYNGTQFDHAMIESAELRVILRRLDEAEKNLDEARVRVFCEATLRDLANSMKKEQRTRGSRSLS